MEGTMTHGESTDGNSGDDLGQGSGGGGRLRWWLLGARWLAAVLTMSWFAIRKSFLWAGDVDRMQQEAAKQYGPQAPGADGDGAAAGPGAEE